MWRFHILLEIRMDSSGKVLDNGGVYSPSFLSLSLFYLYSFSLSHIYPPLSYLLLGLCLCLSVLHYLSINNTIQQEKLHGTLLSHLSGGAIRRVRLPWLWHSSSNIRIHYIQSKHSFLVMQFEINSKLNPHPPCSNFKANMVKPFYSTKCNYRRQQVVVQMDAYKYT